jgi:hypothetical protein
LSYLYVDKDPSFVLLIRYALLNFVGAGKDEEQGSYSQDRGFTLSI